MIRLLTFDLDNTLWETEPVVIAAEARLLAWLAEHAPLFVRNLDADARRAVRQEVLAAQPLLRHRVTALRIAILELGLRKAGYADDHAHELALQGFEVFLEARHALTFFPHAEALLGRLASRYQLATISNGNADVKRLGLQDYFKVIVSADEVGVGKPDPAPFLAALERAGVGAEGPVRVMLMEHRQMRGLMEALQRQVAQRSIPDCLVTSPGLDAVM